MGFPETITICERHSRLLDGTTVSQSWKRLLTTQGLTTTKWPNYVPNQELGFGQLNNLVVELANSQTAAGSNYDLAWLSSLPSGPKVEPTHFYPVTEINGATLPGEMKALQNVIDLVPSGYIDSFGREVVIHRGIREAGTRVGIHIHEYGGIYARSLWHYYRLC